MEKQIITSRLTNEERETHYFIESIKDDVVVADTLIMKDYTRMQKQGWTLVKQYVYQDGTVVGGCFQASRRCLSIRGAQTAKRVPSEKQLEAINKARMQKRTYDSGNKSST